MPGLKIVAPATPRDAKALLKAAIRDDNPVLFLEHKRLYSRKGEERRRVEPRIGRAAVVRRGTTHARVAHEGRARLPGGRGAARRGRHRRRGDRPAHAAPARPRDVLASLARTNRLAVVEEGPRTGGWAGEVLAVPSRPALDDLDDAWRITTPDHPIPYSPPLEDAFLPDGRSIAAEVRARLADAG